MFCRLAWAAAWAAARVPVPASPPLPGLLPPNLLPRPPSIGSVPAKDVPVAPPLLPGLLPPNLLPSPPPTGPVPELELELLEELMKVLPLLGGRRSELPPKRVPSVSAPPVEQRHSWR